ISNTVTDIAIVPLERLSVDIITPDVTYDLAFEVLHGSENAAGNHVSFNLGKPYFDLVEPRRIGRCVVDVHAGVSSQKQPYTLGLVSRKVVRNDMDVTTSRLTGNNVSKECYKLFAGMSLGSFSQHLSGGGIQSSIQRQRSMAIILKTVTLGTPGRERQNRVQPIQSLDGGLLINTKNRRVLGRFEIQTNDIGRFPFKCRVIGQHITADSVRPKLRTCPHPRYHHVADPQMLGQFAGAPMGRTVRRGSTCRVKVFGLHGRRTNLDRPASMARVQTRDTICQKPSLPPKHVMFITTQSLHDR